VSGGRKAQGLQPTPVEATSESPGEKNAPTLWPSQEELALLARLRARDEEAFATLIDRHRASMRRLAAVFVSNRAVAEEVVQDTWTAVIEGLSAFEGRSSLKTWIFRILANRAKTRALRERRTVPFSALADPDAESEPAVDPGRFKPSGKWDRPPRFASENAEALMMRREAVEALDAATEELPPNQRAVVILRDIEGLDSVEVCNILQISETNQRVLLHRARAKLRRVLEKYLDGV
jgi:RNA polymerase sigma-70 factor (ECF subfamily)